MERSERDQYVDVLPENWDAVRLFLAADTQWNHAGMAGIRTGLRYEAVDIVARRLGYVGQEVWQRVLVMERVALEYWAGKRNKYSNLVYSL